MSEKLPGLSTDEAANILRGDLEALKAKVAANKPLSETELRRVRAMALGETGTSQPTSPMDAEFGPRWADNQVMLATVLGIDRKTIQRDLKAEGCPGKEPNGKYDIHAWRSWRKSRGKKATPVKKEVDEKTELECQRLLIDIEERNFDVALKKSQFTSNRDIEQWFGNFAFGIKTEFQSLPTQIAGDIAALFELTPEQAETAKGKIKVFLAGKISVTLASIADGPWEWRAQLQREKDATPAPPA